MAARKDDFSGFQPESSNEDSSTLDNSTREHVRDYAYFAPIGEGVPKDLNDEISEKEDSNGFKRSQSYIDEDDRRELQRIATSISRNRPSVTRAEESFRTLSAVADIPLDDPALDPNNPAFNVSRWIRVFMEKFRQEGHANQTTGLVFKNLNVSGSGSALQLQDTVSTLMTAPARIGELFSFRKKDHKQILRSFNGYMNAGELTIVLGRPGSGCSTLLKSITGQLHGLQLEDGSIIHFDGIPQEQIRKEFRGEVLYNQEVDKHFPHLTVGQTLEFAAACRTSSNRPMGISRNELAKHIAQVVMAVFGLSHTYNTKVGNDFVRGVSGGERKRVSIAEMACSHARFSAWDNSTRGLDSAGALNFVRSLRILADLTGTTSAVAIYQASQAIYDLFEKATVLYEGRQIYFGPASKAKAYFEQQGWYCPPRQTTGDFLTSVTNPSERQAREGMENKVPRTPDDFERYWLNSPEFQALQGEIATYEAEHPHDSDGTHAAKELREEKMLSQAKHVRPKSPYLISIWMQIKLNTIRGYQRIWGDISAQATHAGVNVVMALIIGSIFYGTPDATIGFYSKGSVLFLAVLMNALTAIAEINSLYDQRPIVEKHKTYALYHPWTEAAAGVVADLPVKFVIAVAFNVILYFLSGLRREPSQFFLYFLIIYIVTFLMSAVFRTLAAITKTVSQAMALAGVVVLALVIYTGFTITVPEMHPWFSWIRWINPLFYAFEILVANEFHGRQFTCSARIPAYSPSIGDSWICNTVGSVPGSATVSGDTFIETNYRYFYSHVWRNFGILLGILVGLMAVYFVAVELNSNTSSSAEQLVFLRGQVPAHLLAASKQGNTSHEESPTAAANGEADGKGESEVKAIPPQKDIFTWTDVVYDIEIKGEPRRLLDHVAGYVKPGTLTALMGVSGAGKTTLLDVLAQRTTMGVITGDMLVNGKAQDASFQRKTGYVQQQDLHLETATVRESLRFSAMLRQPKTVSKEEKYKYVEDVIDMLNMREFANAIVGVPGQGLNVEQRKLLTIGVELAAKPKLLLFLDEPTSGLDSQSSWAICAFLRKLADAGQAILCTIHQPSAILFQQFDRLLFLAKGGKTVYFGPIGENSRTLLDYFESNGGRKCGDEENPAEYMLEIVNKGKNDQEKDWYNVWNDSNERTFVLQEIEEMHASRQHQPVEEDPHASDEFAMPFMAQLQATTIRVFQQYWRMPSYVASKWMLATAAGLFIGFSFFDANGTIAGTQNVIFSVFMLTTIFSTLVEQIQPLFVTQRSLYEVRERPSKSYSWKAFMVANLIVEIPYQVFAGILAFATYYYAVNGVQSSLRQVLVLLFVISLFMYSSTFAHMTIAALPDAQTAAALVTMLMIMMMMFCGVLQSPSALPGFWIFMYRVSPFTYWIAGIVATQVHERAIHCSSREFSVFSPPSGQTCGEYLAAYLQAAPGALDNPNATSDCRYCSLSNADQYIAGNNIYWSEKWRNYGIFWAFIVFNAFIAILTYWAFRVKKWNNISFTNRSKEDKKEKETQKKEDNSHFNVFRQ